MKVIQSKMKFSDSSDSSDDVIVEEKCDKFKELSDIHKKCANVPMEKCDESSSSSIKYTKLSPKQETKSSESDSSDENDNDMVLLPPSM